MASYHQNLESAPVKYVYGRYMIFNIVSIIYWWFITAIKQCQFDIDYVCKKDNKFIFEYSVGDLVYVCVEIR